MNEPPPRLAELTWIEARALAGPGSVALLPAGAVEAHGPHLPLATDVEIAQGMAEAAGVRLRAGGLRPLLLPPLVYTTARFARGFAGTLSVAPETVTALVVDLGRSLAAHGFALLAVANAHFEPAHLAALAAAVARLEEEGIAAVAPDLTRRRHAERLGEEFRSGACHAGRYEGSIVLARRPELVRGEVARALPPNPASLLTAIRDGRESFETAGGPQAYFGDPAAASAEEGEATLAVLGEILAEAVRERLRRAL